jgi:hypothetical protein
MINDCSFNIFEKIPLEELRNESKFNNLIKKYKDIGKNKVNCQFKLNNNGTIVSIITTKYIKKYQELLIYYDFIFWLNLNYGNQFLQDKLIFNNIYNALK